MIAAEAGGGSGGGDLIVDHGTLRDVATELALAAGTLEECGGDTPGMGDLGEAGALLAVVLAGVSEAGARLAFEAKTLSTVVGECNQAAATADRDAAASYLVAGT